MALCAVGVVDAITTPKSGINYVDVASCEQVGKDVKVSLKGGQKYTLTSTIRNAGHGLRDYKLNCVSATKYKVEWTEVITNTTSTTPVVAPTTTSTPASTSTPVTATTPVTTSTPTQNTIPAPKLDTKAPVVYLSGKSNGNGMGGLGLNVYAIDSGEQSPIVKIEVYQANKKWFTWENNSSTSATISKNFNTVGLDLIPFESFVAKVYDKAGNVGVSDSLDVNMLELAKGKTRVVNQDISWIYRNIMMKMMGKNKLKKFVVYVGNDKAINSMSVTAICEQWIYYSDYFSCSYYNPLKIKPSGYAFVKFWDQNNKVYSIPAAPFSL